MESILNESAVTQLTCLVCGKNVEAGWFAQVNEGGHSVYFCSPGCALKHYETQGYSTGTGQENSVPDWSDLNKYL